MCEECRKNPCDSRCPNAPAPKHVFVCSNCGHSIVEGEDYYDVLGEQFCEYCMQDMKKVAEYDPY